MRVCLVAESYAPALGGVEYSLQRIVDGFIARGHQVRVIAASWEGHKPGVETNGNLTIVRIRTLPFLRRFWFVLFSIPSVIRAAIWADLIQGSTFAGGPPAFLGAWLRRKKCVLLVHEVYGSRWFQFEPNPIKSLFYCLTERIIVRLPFDRYVAPSNYTRDSLCSIGVAAGKIAVIYHGDSKLEVAAASPVDYRAQLGFTRDDFVFLTFGRTGVTKGIEHLVAAIPGVIAQVANARFVLVLSGYDRRIWKGLQKVVGALPAGICKLVPPVEREVLAAYLAAADCVVIPSLSEGFGFSALEACNAGKIVVATDAGALPEVVFGRHVFVKPGSAEEIARGCVKAFREEVAVVPEKKFDWDRAVGEYLKLYDRVLSESRSDRKN